VVTDVVLGLHHAVQPGHLGRELGASPLATHAALALVQRLGPALLDRDFAPRPRDGQELADATYL
jgi:hypothetical protein